MKTRKTLVITAAVLIMLAGVMPVLASTTQSTDQSTTITKPFPQSTEQFSTKSGATQSEAQSPAQLIQVAQGAQTWAQQLVDGARQRGINVTQAQALINQGGLLIAQAQYEANSNPSQASQDALQAMSAFKSAVRPPIVTPGPKGDESGDPKDLVQKGQIMASEFQGPLAKVCSAPGSSSSRCADGANNLAQAKKDLDQASSIAASLASPPNQNNVNTIVGLVKDAMNHLQQVSTDINELAKADGSQQGASFVQGLFQKLSYLQQRVQDANLSSTLVQQDEAELSQARTLLNSAIQAFQYGNFESGVQLTDQATQLMVQVSQTLTQVSQTTNK